MKTPKTIITAPKTLSLISFSSNINLTPKKTLKTALILLTAIT